MRPQRDHLVEFLATIRGAIGSFLITGSGFILLGVIALKGALAGDWHEPFLLGNVPIPTYYGAGASNSDVVIFCSVGILFLAIVIVRRYLYYRDVVEALRKKGITDYDKVDSFADNFLDDDFS